MGLVLPVNRMAICRVHISDYVVHYSQHLSQKVVTEKNYFIYSHI